MPRHLLWEASCACQWGPSMGPVSASWELAGGAGAPPRILPEFCLKVVRIKIHMFPRMFWIIHFAHGLLVPCGREIVYFYLTFTSPRFSRAGPVHFQEASS